MWRAGNCKNFISRSGTPGALHQNATTAEPKSKKGALHLWRPKGFAVSVVKCGWLLCSFGCDFCWLLPSPSEEEEAARLSPASSCRSPTFPEPTSSSVGCSVGTISTCSRAGKGFSSRRITPPITPINRTYFLPTSHPRGSWYTRW